MPPNKPKWWAKAQREQREFEAWLERREIVLARRIGAARNKFVRGIAAQYELTPDSQFTLLERTHAEAIQKLLTASYRQVVAYQAGLTLDRIRSLKRIPNYEGYFERLIQSWIRLNALDKAESIAATAADDVRRAIARGVDNGEGNREIGRAIRKVTGLTVSRALTVARTEVHGAALFASETISKQAEADFGLKLMKFWVPTLDSRTRDAHAAMAGKSEPMDGMFNVGGRMMSRPGDPAGGAANVINCLHPDSIIDAATPESLSRRHYKGSMVIIELENGNKLSVTPNHPILTGGGWIGAAELVEGQEIVCAGGSDKRIGKAFNIQNIKPSVEEIYNSLSIHGMGVRMAAVVVDFHGDITDKGVDIIPIDGKLRNSVEAFSFDPFNKLSFALPNLILRRKFISCLFLVPALGALGAANGVMGCLNLVGTLRFGHARPFKGLGLRLGARLNSALLKAQVNTASAYSKFVAYCLNRIAKAVEADDGIGMLVMSRITRHVMVPYEGFVYNLTDKKSYYICNGIVNHNCRCSLIYREVEDVS